MKREGRQHGMVRTHCILPSTTLTPVFTLPRKANSLNGAPPVAGVFVKVSSKPTNHSKFTGKCRRARCVSCHLHPSSKSKDKTKGSSKIGSFVVLDEILDYTHLGKHREEEDEDEEEVEYDDNGCCDIVERPSGLIVSTGHQNEVRDETVVQNEEDDLGFFDVAISLEPFDGDEGWSLVGLI